MNRDRTATKEYHQLLGHDFHAFLERSFHELNPTYQFMDNWHIGVMAYELERIRSGENDRLMILIPPRSLKSHTASVAFPAFMLGHHPGAQIICVSHGQELADKLAADCRALMTSRFYKDVFRTRLTSERSAVEELKTTRRGFRYATSVGGPLIGRGADILIIDDPLKPEEALSRRAREFVNGWYEQTLLTRLNDKKTGRIVLIMQRLHEDDLVGHILEKAGGEKWRVLRLPAFADQEQTYSWRDAYGRGMVHTQHKYDCLHPEREDADVLRHLAEMMGRSNFFAQYLLSPVPEEGAMVKQHWFKRYTRETCPSSWQFTFESWDTANKATERSDFSVCTTWGVLGGKTCFLLDVYRGKLDYPALKRMVIDQKKKWQASTVLIEDRASGTQLIQELHYGGCQGVVGYKAPTDDKIMRMHTCCDVIENGLVYLPEQAERQSVLDPRQMQFSAE